MTDNTGFTGSNEPNGGHLRAFLERIERLETEKAELGADIKDVYSEAKSSGFDVKIMRKVLALRKIDPDKRAEEEEILSLYLAALGQLDGTPLGQAAVARKYPSQASA